MRKTVSAVLLAALLAALFAGCGLFGGGGGGSTYEGQTNITYPLLPDRETFPPINVLGEDRKYVQCGVTLEISDSNLVKEFDEKLHRLHDMVNLLVRNKSLQELEHPDITVVLAQELVDAVNAEFNTLGVRRAVFSPFSIYTR